MKKFGKSVKSRVAPTHLQWTKSKDFKAGRKTLVETILTKHEWKTLTFVGRDFKYNMKFEDNEEFEATDVEVWDNIKDDDHLFLLVDTSNPKNNEFGCEVRLIDKPAEIEINWDSAENATKLLNYESVLASPSIRSVLDVSQQSTDSQPRSRSSKGKGKRAAASTRSESPTTDDNAS